MTNIDKLTSMAHREQTGVSLVIALIALVAMSLAGIALIRSVDTTNVIAGNLAFRQATLQATDVGVETALAALTTIASSSPDANHPSGCAVGACNYYPTMQVVDTSGIPTSINWSLIPATAVNTGFTVQYVIDRLCNGPTPVTDLTAKCMHTTGLSVGSKKAGAVAFTSAQQVYFRVTIRAIGPRSTISMVQVLYAR